MPSCKFRFCTFNGTFASKPYRHIKSFVRNLVSDLAPQHTTAYNYNLFKRHNFVLLSKADKTKALGVSWTSGKVNEDGTIPDDSAISISGKGVADGKLSIQKGNLAELYVIGTQDATPSDAVWWSDGAAVTVSGTGTVYGVQTGTAKVNVKAGNQTATITITVK